ncbi:Calx-beta domain-containing protein [Maribacter sp. CXY002]|uniref:Calx-beta domain-containing protein n=1 Tax=Maribacter luteocoastalis TaxID=3407671 RepID=UPI003B66B974
MKLKIIAMGFFKTKCIKLAIRLLPLFFLFGATILTAQTVNIQATQPNANETGPADGQYSVSVTAGDPFSIYTIDLQIDPASTAISGDDYAVLPASVNILTDFLGNGSRALDLNVVDDDIVELTENVILNITNSPGLTPVASSAEVEITNNDTGIITVVLNILEGNEEGPSSASFRILSDKPNGTGSTVITDYTLTGSATVTTDYTVTGNANFASNGTTVLKNFTINPVDDTLVEGTEEVTITLNSTNNALFTIGAADNATVSILDNDYTATITATDALANENGGTGEFTIDLGDVNNTGNAITVNYTITGSADNTDDYSTIAGNVTIADGNQTALVTITPVDDDFFEGTEDIILTLAAGTGYELGTGDTATVSISDNDVVGVNVAPTTGTTTEAGGTATFVYTLTSQPTADVVLRIDQYDGSETSGPSNITITPANWNTGVSLIVTGEDDTMVDGDIVDPIRVRMDNSADPNYNSLSDNDVPDVVVTNLDDDEFVVSMVTTDPNASENTPANDSGSFLISLNQINNTGAVLTINFTLSGNATEGSDFSNINTSVSIPDGGIDANVFITPVDDTIVENSETVTLTLSSGAGYSVDNSNDTGTVTIADNDFTVTVTATDNNAAESTPTSATGEFTIDLGKPNNTGGAITINFAMSGVAVDGTDYTTVGTSATIFNGQQTETITIVSIDDTIMEGSESVTITLVAGTGYALGGTASRTATVTIADNDQATLSIADKAINENDVTGLLELDVTLDIAVVGGTTVSYTFSDDTATGGGVDYSGNVAPNNVLTFTGTAGEVQSIEFTIINDQLIEDTETFNVQLGSPTNGVQLNDGNAVGAINDDDNCVAAPILDPTVSTLFCDVIDRSLNDYTSSTPPPGTTLVWSRNSNPLNENAYLLPSEVENPPNAGSFYGFFLDDNGTPNNFDDDCASGTIAVEIVLNETPTLDSVTDNERCGSGTLLLRATPSSGASINWYDSVDADTPIAVGEEFTTPVLSTTRTYYAEAIENGCASERQPVIATIGFQATTGVATNSSICNVATNGPTIVDLDNRLSGASTGLWVVKTDPSNSIVLTSENSIDFTGLASGNYVFTFTTIGSTAPCTEVSVDVTISVSDCETDDDNDGLLGGQEATLGTDPNNPDTDGDGIEDGVEVGPDLINPLDEDNDGIIDALDSNTDDADSDGVNDQQDPANENPCIPDNSSVDCPVDLEIAKSANRLDAIAGDEIVFTVTVNNLTDKLVVEAVIGDFIETGFQYVSHTESTGSYDELSGQWVIENLTALATSTLEITVLVQEEGTYTNTAELLSSTPLDENPDNDTATVTIATVVPEGIDLAITKSVDNATPLVGDQIIFTITVENQSELGDVINNISVQDSVEPGQEALFDFGSSSADVGTYDEVTGIWTIPSLEVGEENSVTLQIIGTVTREGTFDNSAILVNSSPRDSKPDNDQSKVTVVVGVPTPTDPGFLFNQFSPNGDGINDMLTINLRNQDTGLNETVVYKINIFDRYGNLVYTTEEQQTGKQVWDGTYKGKEVPKGTYFYILNYSINNSEPTVDKGWIQLIR